MWLKEIQDTWYNQQKRKPETKLDLMFLARLSPISFKMEVIIKHFRVLMVGTNFKMYHILHSIKNVRKMFNCSIMSIINQYFLCSTVF